MPIKVVAFLILLTGLAGSCRSTHNDDLLLQIGKYQLTAADYAFVKNSAPYKALADEQLHDRLVEDGRILAYSLEHRFDTIELLNQQLLYAMRYYASSVDGYVWNKKVKPLLQVTTADIRKAYAGRAHVLRTYEQEEASIREALLFDLQQKYIRESQQQVLQETKPRLYDAAIAAMAAAVVEKERKWPGIDPGLLLMEYELGGVHRPYTAADFIEFVHCQPVFIGSLANVEDVKKMLHAHLIGLSLYAEGQRLGMERDPAYQQVRRQCQYNLFINYFKQQHIYPRIGTRQALFSRQEKALLHELDSAYPIEINRLNDIQ